MKQNPLTLHVQNFFQSHLPMERGLSQNTVMSYRDTIKLYLRHLVSLRKRPVQKMQLNEMTARNVLSFLDASENDRNNSVKTRNQRLAVLKSFFAYLLNMDPVHADEYAKIFHLKAKRSPYKPIVYLLDDEMREVLKQIDRATLKGQRDYALLLFLYNTGARAQEACDLKISDLRMEKPFATRLHGKGNKTRHVPLWAETVSALKGLMASTGVSAADESSYVFTNRRKTPLSRFGLRYLLGHYVDLAARKYPELKKKKVSPHTIRHTTAMHLLQAGVDITVIKEWLGHVDLNTTHGYVEIDMEMKERALAKTKGPRPSGGYHRRINADPDLLEWLESFGDM